MNDNAKALVAALRSGKYKQGQEQLRTKENEFCCLGVACDLHSKATGTNWVLADEYNYLGSESVLPGEVIDWLQFSNEEGTFGERPGRLRQSLVFLNDSDNRSFDEIADVIESEPEGLFA